MKAKKLELRPTTLTHNDYKVFEMYYDGKKIPVGNYFYNTELKIYIHILEMEVEDEQEIEIYNYAELPDRTPFNLEWYKSAGKGIMCFIDIKRIGKKLLVKYDIHSMVNRKDSLWNPILLLKEIVDLLEKQGFKKYAKYAVPEIAYNGCKSVISKEFDNPKGTIDETVDIGINSIKRARYNAHVNLLNLAARELKAISKSK